VESDKELKTIIPDFYHIYSNKLEDVENPQCWKSPIKFDKGLLVLDNLSEKKSEENPHTFKIVDKTALMDLEHFKLAFDAIALFHGACWNFINGDLKENHQQIRKKTMKIYKAIVPKWAVNWLLENEFVKPMASVTKLCENRNISKDIIQKFQNYIDGHGKEIFRTLLIQLEASKSSIITLTHGDTWSNNFLFSYDDCGKPNQIKLIDYQIMSIHEPYRDLYLMLYLNSDREFRKTNMEILLQCYYEKLSQTIGAEKIPLSYKQFKEEWNKYRAYSIAFAVLYMPAVLATGKIMMDTMAQADAASKELKKRISDPDSDDDHPNTRELRRRIIDIILELNDEGEFDKE